MESPAPASRPPRRSRRVGLSVVASLGLAAAVSALVLLVPASAERTGTGGPAPSGGSAAVPDPDSEPSLLLTADVSLPDVTCDLPPLGSTEQQLHTFYQAQLRCLDAAWAPTLRRMEVTFAPVRLRIADNPTTACGPLPPPEEATGLYCDLDTTIYLPKARILTAFGLAPEPHIATLAHEYGHHVQYLSGVLVDAGRELARYEPGSAQDRELGRRVELQANCLAGMFLASVAGRGSVSTELAQAAVEDFRNWIDSETHGSSRTQRRWARAGYRGPTVASCNTWNASTDHVE